jgi:outer membrane putative beta-barrel porin/alpha-amylase
MQRAWLIATALLTAGLLTAAASAGDRDQYTLFNPVPTDKMRAFNTDRPTKSFVPYTVDAGHFQYEGDFFIYGYNNVSTPDTNITSWTVGNPTFKLGLLDNVDFEVNISFYNSIRATQVSTGNYVLGQGFGDTFTRFKWNLFGNDGNGPALALIPYAKWPTAPIAPQGIGNGFIEGGLIAPLAIPLPAGFTMIVMGEMDLVKNAFNDFYRVNIPALININRPIFKNVTAYAEIYANWSTDPRASNIYTADFAVAWQPWPNFQLDVGVNVGLNYAAIPYQIYAGIAQRF